MAAMTKIQFATLTAVLGLATMGGAGYIAYANTSPHDTGGKNAAVVSGGQGANGGGTTQANGSSGQGGGSDSGTNGATGGSGGSGAGDSGDDNADAQCVNGDVQVTETSGEGAAGHVSLLLVFQNVSGHACRLQGYPGASLVDQSGKDLLDAKRTLSGYVGGAVGLQKAPDVLLAANGKASAVLEWSDVPDSSQPGGCDVQSASSLLVTPPNFTQSTTLNLGAGAAVCSDFQIHPVLQGVVSEPGGA
jgi:hypothetical protein